MKKLKSLFVATAILAVTTFTFSCADPNAKNPDQNPSNENTTEAPKEDPLPEVVKKTIGSEEDFQKAMEELYAEIAAFFMPAPSANMRAAAPTEAELFEGDKAIEPLSEFMATFFKAVLEADQDSELDPLSPFALSDSINVENLSFDQIMKAVDKFLVKEENKNLVKELFGTCDSADAILEDLADSLELEDFEALKAKLNECVTLTKLKYSGYLRIDPRESRKAEEDYPFNPENPKYELTSEIMGIFNISDLNEEFGLKVEKLDSLLQFLTGNTAAFPIKNVTADEALKIDNALFMAPLGGDYIWGDEAKKDEWLAGDTSSMACPDPDRFGIDGTASSKIAFDFETASYKGTIEVSLNLEATTELFKNIMKAVEEDAEDFPVELFNELGNITVSVKDSEISMPFGIGDLIDTIAEANPKK